MPRHTPLYDWTNRVTTAFPDRPPAHARGLAEWSYGLVLARGVQLVAVTLHLAALLEQKVNTVRQRLREPYQPGERKAGHHRSTFDPHACRGPLVRRITGGWADKRVAIALDASNPGDRFVVLAAAVVYRGVGIPVAWRVRPADAKGESRNDIRVTLIERVREALGDDGRVFVPTDRGLESATRFRDRVKADRHPLMRVKAGALFRPAGWARWRRMGTFATREGDRFAARGKAYPWAKEPLACTPLACRVAGCEDSWLIPTDLPPSAADPCRYAFRSWIERGFRLVKRGGWGWHKTRMTDVTRVERVWAAMALGTVWVVEVGGLSDHEERAETVPPMPRSRGRRPKRSNRPGDRRRRVRVSTRGLVEIVVGLMNGESRTGRFVPEPWPRIERIPKISEAEFDARE